ncbi:hypothetical protein [Syntrophomonas palmitatica]|uniref:hypothetical protein n=1 Tax=Syntrophomonas palmitatica TaxID=402877 RepID=UPI0006D0F84A|nr:hypothetical protein [Syntrophomonas palmitatica]
MIATFPLHPSAAKFIIAKGTAMLPQVQHALKNNKIIIGAGTTNIAVVQQLLGIQTPKPDTRVAGLICQNVACGTAPEGRLGAWCIDKGKMVDVNWLEFLHAFAPGDIFIKGANALDPSGMVGILVGDPMGGTIGQAIGILKARGNEIICPVGLEKMIPSCQAAERLLGVHRVQHSMGYKTGYIVVANVTLITETEALRLLFGVKAYAIAAGGVGGMEGSTMLAVEYENEEQIQAIMALVREANRIPPLKINKRKCKGCLTPCDFAGL